jgi:aspartokinase/homoserine dehydrogenase 1
MISQASSEQELCIVVDQQHAQSAVSALNLQFEQERMLGIVDQISASLGFSVVNLVLGKAMQKPGVASKFFTNAARAGCNLVAIAQVSFLK